MVLECCHSLVTIADDGQTLRRAQYAIQDYLVDNSMKLFPQAGAMMAYTCLHMCSARDSADGPWAQEEEARQRMTAWLLPINAADIGDIIRVHARRILVCSKPSRCS
jgi:hypothetical protein